MPRQKKKTADEGHGVDSMPTDLTLLEPIVKEFVDKLKTLKNEQELLKQDEKALMEEYAEKLDMKTMKAALRVVAISEKVERKGAFDALVEVLERVSGSGE